MLSAHARGAFLAGRRSPLDTSKSRRLNADGSLPPVLKRYEQWSDAHGYVHLHEDVYEDDDQPTDGHRHRDLETAQLT